MSDTVEKPKEVPLTATTATEATIPLPATKIAVVPNWKSVLKTYSFWFYVSSIVITLLDQILPLLGMIEPLMTGSTYVVVVFTLNLLGVVSRFIQQRKLWQYPTEPPKDV
jgi:uncharacterized membrane protein